MDYLGKGEVLTITDFRQICEQHFREMLILCIIENVLDLSVHLMKNGSKNKSVAFIFLFSVGLGIFPGSFGTLTIWGFPINWALSLF